MTLGNAFHELSESKNSNMGGSKEHTCRRQRQSQ